MYLDMRMRDMRREGCRLTIHIIIGCRPHGVLTGFGSPPARGVQAPPPASELASQSRIGKTKNYHPKPWVGGMQEGSWHEPLTACTHAIVRPRVREATPQHRFGRNLVYCLENNRFFKTYWVRGCRRSQGQAWLSPQATLKSRLEPQGRKKEPSFVPR